MQQDVVFLLALAPIVGLLMFTTFARSHKAHIKRLREIIAFFFWPYPPRRMLIVREVDGTVRVLYDDEFEVVRSRDRYFVRTRYGEQYVTRFDPGKTADIVSTYDARGPRGHPSPMGLAVRWVVAAAFTVFLVYSAMITAWFPGPEVVSQRGGYIVAKPAEVDPWVTFPVTMVFVVTMAWFITNIMRFGDRSIEYASYVALSIEPPYQELFPSIAPDSRLSPSEVLRHIGRELKIVVSDAVRKALKAIEDKVGSEELAAAILAKLAMADVWRETVANVIEESRYVRKAGETMAALRFKMVVPRVRVPVVLLTLIVGVVVGFIAGFVFGNVWAVSPAPPVNATATTAPAATAMHIRTLPTPAQQPPPPMVSTVPRTGIQPATPPPPPVTRAG